MNLLDYLNITIESIDSKKTVISVLVTDNLKQPFGLVHGGINAVLAETAASLAANEFAPTDYVAVGTNVNTTHLRPVVDGKLITTASPIKLGKSLQIWDVKTIHFPSNKLTSTSTVTTMLQQKTTQN